jgi:voltage-gated potassium channel
MALEDVRDNSLRRRLYEILEEGSVHDRTSRLIRYLLVTIIVVNLTGLALESVPVLEARYRSVFAAIEIVSLVAFTIEYFVRLWVAVEHQPHRHLAPGMIRLKYVTSTAGLIDLLAVAPFWIWLLTGADLRVLMMFRVLRFLKLTRYSPGMRSLLDAVNAERRGLIGCIIILLGATLISAVVMHVIEREAQPEKFGTIPDAMWWSIVTLATVGFGDVVPITPLGKIVGSIAIVFGVIIVALPVGIIATAFANEIHRRDFVVTWSMVARVPLFAGLEAADIADISRLLRAQAVESGAAIVRKGDVGHSMYFVASGDVEIELKEGNVRLGVGDFFGEVAVLRRTRRSATVTALSRTNLLVLDARDLEALMEREQRIADRIQEVMRTRMGAEATTQAGDILPQEIEQGEREAPAPGSPSRAKTPIRGD